MTRYQVVGLKKDGSVQRHNCATLESARNIFGAMFAMKHYRAIIQKEIYIDDTTERAAPRIDGTSLADAGLHDGSIADEAGNRVGGCVQHCALSTRPV